ncbi:MAG: TM1266 family iron-only hydrogenase system putative regulator [Clostridiales bacterium]
MENKIAVIGIVIIDKNKAVKYVNTILSDFSESIIGRMGIPYKERNLSVISIIVDANTDTIGSLTGKLGNIKGVKVKVAFTY